MLLYLLHNCIIKTLYHPFLHQKYNFGTQTNSEELYSWCNTQISLNTVNSCKNSDLSKKDNNVLPIKLLSRCFSDACLKVSFGSCPTHLLSLWKSSPSKSMSLHRPNLAKLFSLICLKPQTSGNPTGSTFKIFRHSPPPLPQQQKPWPKSPSPHPPE